VNEIALPTVDIQQYVEAARAAGRLVVQPRMGMSAPEAMAAGLRAVAGARARAVGTLTIDSYTRVEDIAGADRALAAGKDLNGYPIVNHGPGTTTAVAAAAGGRIPVQVRHGSARPGHIFRAMLDAGLTASEGGPVSYCLPYSRLPLAESVPAWADACRELAEDARARGHRAHLETFGGCMLGQMCPPSLLVALSVLEAMFFTQCGLTSVSLSYAQQTNAVQDIEALAALHHLADRFLPAGTTWHVVLYTYMGVYPGTRAGARQLLDVSAQIAVRGGASRLIVKTEAEAHRIPTVAENIAALERAARVAQAAVAECPLPWAREVDYGDVYGEALALIEAVLAGDPDIGRALRKAFAAGVLDVPFCLHRDNAGAAQGAIGDDGRLVWARPGVMPLTARSATAPAVTSDRLLGMLRYAADLHDRTAAALEAPAEPYRVAIVGSGPRGLAVAERIAARLAETPPAGREVEISLIDRVQVGAGRVWRPEQSPHLLMNTACGEVTMFSGPSDGGPARAGAGPTLAEWWATHRDDFPGPNSYAPRAVYGEYLNFYLEAIAASLPYPANLRRVTAEVTSVHRTGGRWQLTVAGGEPNTADRVILTTGHPQTELGGEQARLAAFAAASPHARYIRGDSAADMPLHTIEPGARVAVLGMGLSFYDVASVLTLGRGGAFAGDGHGGLRYLPSGREPLLFAGSRSGVPLPARGSNQKGPEWRYTARLFTPQRVRAMRAGGALDFRRQVWPWIDAEMQLVYHATALRARYGTEVEEAYVSRAVDDIAAEGPEAAAGITARLAAQFGIEGLPELSMDRLARPFAGRRFTGPKEFTEALAGLLESDIAEARLGNHDGPLKAALDVLRDVRGTIRTAVDYGGLTARSHREDFLGWFVPLSSFLAAGPPLERLQQTLALMDAGILTVVGPSVRFTTDGATGRFEVSSGQVDHSRQLCDVMLDARIPSPDITRDTSPLTRDLTRSGIWTSWANTAGTERFDTAGVAVTASPFRPVDATGAPAEGLHVLGIPTEGQRWFMQVGSARPGPWTEFSRDADAIAAAVLDGLPAGVARHALEGAR
jgi:glutamate mutase epsilon subunit